MALRARKKRASARNKRDGGHYRMEMAMEPDEKHRNKGTRLERDLNSLFFEDEDQYWPKGWWSDPDEEEEDDEE